ncbi:MAG: hypothetical protein H5U38_14025 [Calditrichaeota bacterium]|nr:hypothetical protein [Calditrichota bacterium]
MERKGATLVAWSLVTSLLFGGPSLLRTERQNSGTGASNVQGHTYYWDEAKGAWRTAGGAVITALREGEACAETSSDAEGRYDLCVSSCCRPSGTLHLVASYGDLHDYFVTNPCGLIVQHDFYCIREEQRVQPQGQRVCAGSGYAALLRVEREEGQHPEHRP